jgi:hypothetical protein
MIEKGTYFDAVSGVALHYGPTDNAVAQGLARDGHTFIKTVNGLREKVKWDSVAGALVPDPRYDQWDQDRENTRARREEIKTELATLYGQHTAVDINQQVDLLNELARI